MPKQIAQVTLAALRAAGASPTKAKELLEPTKAACALFQIDTAQRISLFLANAAHESNKFQSMQENLYYTTPDRLVAVFPSRIKNLNEAQSFTKNPQKLANRVYANRMGNGDEASGDGWKYRGRGLFQLTFRDNYKEAQEALNRPYLDQPELVGEVSDAVLTAAWFWHKAGCNELVDTHQYGLVTRSINGPARLGHDERMAHYKAVMDTLA
jgi:putative chitinase